MAPTWDAATVSFAVAGLVNLALAVTLIAINMTSRVNRVFALFLTLRGVLNLTTVLSDPAHAADLGDRVGPYLRMAVPVAAAYFGVVFWASNSRAPTARLRRVARPVGIGLFAVLVACCAWYALDHGAYNAALEGAAREPGPLYVFTGLNLVGYAGVAALLMHTTTRHADPLQRRSVTTVATGFALNPLFATASAIVLGGRPWAARDATPYELVASTWVFLGGALVVVAAVRMALAARDHDDADVRRGTRRAVVALWLPVLTAGIMYVGAQVSPALGQSLNDVFAAVWVLSLPALVTYAILRHQLFGFEVRVRGTLKQSTVAGLFATAFFIASETIEAYLPVEGTVAGIAAAGALALGLRPIQRFSERVAAAMMPDARPLHEVSTKDRMAMYMEQVRVAWADGNLTSKDRRMLDVGRDRLGISREEAAILEETVVAALGLRKPGPGATV